MRGEPFRAVLASAAAGPGTGRFSIACARPQGWARLVGERQVEVTAIHDDGSRSARAVRWRFDGADPFDALRGAVRWFTRGTRRPEEASLPFAGGAVGWLSYELGRRLVPSKFPGRRADVDPPLAFALYGGAIVRDEATGTTWIAAIDTALGGAEEEAGRLRRLWERAERWSEGTGGSRTGSDSEPGTVSVSESESVAESVAVADAEPDADSGAGAEAGTGAEYAVDAWDHAAAVEEIRRRIGEGDLYQANLSLRFHAPTAASVDRLWARLRERSPEPFAACLEGEDRAVLCGSMERLLAVRGRRVETRPIKGTRPRNDDPDLDRRAAEELASSEKDRAELLMVVDVHRNDLGKVCVPGSVEVPTLFGRRRFARVHHLEAEVRGLLRPELDELDALRAVFPAGSITGAPKVRAMQVIESVEPSPRGVYCGAVGYLGQAGEADFAVAIRTAVLAGGVLRWSAGGGIVWDSEPEDELREAFAKGIAFREIARAG